VEDKVPSSIATGRCAAQPSGAMHLRFLAVFCMAIGAISGCAASPLAEVRLMKTCVDGAAPTGVSAESFSAALMAAQKYSDEKYGSDCVVCAEVLDRPEEYMLHITSPIEDALINTSAAITVRKSDGVVTSRAIWHSCHARIRKSARWAPDKSLAAHTSAIATITGTASNVLRPPDASLEFQRGD
jgi:hypothetical protein